MNDIAEITASGIEWGAVSEWVSGVATVVAVVVALTFSLRSERDQRNAQLAAVYAWAEVAQGPEREGTLWLTNNTTSPIYDWHVVVTWNDEAGEAGRVETGFADHGLLPPGRHSFTFSGGDTPLPENDASVRVQLSFRDAHERRLRRLSSGKLENLA